MGKKIIRITESDITKIVKKVLAEQGGYDDPGIMAVHGMHTHGSIYRTVAEIGVILNQTKQAFEQNISKREIMNGIINISNSLNTIKEMLKKITPEILLNNDLKTATKNLNREIEKGLYKLRLLGGSSESFIHPNMPRSMTGIGFSLNPEDLNDKLYNILITIGEAAEKLMFQLKDESESMGSRIRKHGGFG